MDVPLPVLHTVLGGVLHRQRFNGRLLLPVILQDPDRPKRDNAAVMGGIRQRLHLILVHHTEGRLGAAPDGIQLVAGLGAVEIELSVGIDIADGHRIGIVSIAGQGQHPMAPPLQNSGTLLLRHGLTTSAHCTKHEYSPFLSSKRAKHCMIKALKNLMIARIGI